MAHRSSNAAVASGLDVLISFRQRRRVGRTPSAPDEAAWRKWAACDFLELWQLVALHSLVDPDSLGASPEQAARALRHSSLGDTIQHLLGRPIDERPMARLRRNFECAVRALKAGDLSPLVRGTELGPRTCVHLDEFVAWSKREFLPVAGNWVPRHERGSTPHAWLVEFPYRTKELEIALNVARDLADRYMHDDTSRAPSSPAAIRHAIDCYGASETAAKAIVRLIRPNHLPQGRRRKRRC